LKRNSNNGPLRNKKISQTKQSDINFIQYNMHGIKVFKPDIKNKAKQIMYEREQIKHESAKKKRIQAERNALKWKIY